MSEEKKDGRRKSRAVIKKGRGAGSKAGQAQKKGLTRTCPACGRPVDDAGKVCPSCGAPVDPGAIRQV